MVGCLSIDWLCVNYRGGCNDNQRFKFRLLDYGCRQFRKIYEVYDGFRVYGTVVACPVLRSLPEDFIQLKLSNEVLYSMDISELLSDLANFCRWDFVAISRLDICMDFYSFHNGLLPQTLIKQFLGGVIVPITKCSFAVNGQFKKDVDFQYLRVGSRSSDVVARLYNKSEEMRSSVYKHYISDYWKTCGLKQDRDVWRLEFQLQGKAKSFVSCNSGEVINIDFDLLSNNSKLSELYFLLCYRYFRFKKPCSDKNKSRWSDVQLFDGVQVASRRLVAVDCLNTTRSLKIFAVQLARFAMANKTGMPVNDGIIKEAVVSWLVANRLNSYVSRRGVFLQL